MKPAFILALMALHLSCSHRYPCTDSGVSPWDPPIGGDVYCQKKQVKGKTGEEAWVLHGEYLLYHPNGALAVEGQFLDGKKEGVWAQYGENGAKSREVFYVNGVLQPQLPSPEEIEKSKAVGGSSPVLPNSGGTSVIEGKGKLR